MLQIDRCAGIGALIPPAGRLPNSSATVAAIFVSCPRHIIGVCSFRRCSGQRCLDEVQQLQATLFQPPFAMINGTVGGLPHSSGTLIGISILTMQRGDHVGGSPIPTAMNRCGSTTRTSWRHGRTRPSCRSAPDRTVVPVRRWGICTRKPFSLKVAHDRVKDPDAHHVHKSLSCRQDRFKAHLAVESVSGIITDCAPTKASWGRQP